MKYTKAAIDDSLRLKKSGLKEKAEKLLEIIERLKMGRAIKRGYTYLVENLENFLHNLCRR